MKKTTRYKEAQRLIELYKPTTVVGHSLGSAILKSIVEDGGNKLIARLYGSPVFNQTDTDNITYYSHNLDLVSAISHGNKTRTPYYGLNPHAYDGF